MKILKIDQSLIYNLVYKKDTKEFLINSQAWNVKDSNLFMLGRSLGNQTFYYSETIGGSDTKSWTRNCKTWSEAMIIHLPSFPLWGKNVNYHNHALGQTTFSSNRLAVALFEKAFNKDFFPKDAPNIFHSAIHKNTVLVPQIIEYNREGIIQQTVMLNDGYTISDADQPLIIYDLSCIGTNGKTWQRSSALFFDPSSPHPLYTPSIPQSNTYPGPLFINYNTRIAPGEDKSSLLASEIYVSSSYPWRKVFINRNTSSGAYGVNDHYWKPDYDGQIDTFIINEGHVIDELKSDTGTRVIKSQILPTLVQFITDQYPTEEEVEIQEPDSVYVKI